MKLKEEIQKNNENNTTDGTENDELPDNEKRLMKDCVNMALKTKMSATGSSKGESSQPRAGGSSSHMDVTVEGGIMSWFELYKYSWKIVMIIANCFCHVN